ncbi:DUF6916 family protein [Conexibacter arvalis]|uniref:DUF6916 domain-containing protein n=1 Tax=Conexibacter arvalis TaxID=912552 RepID=A0A840IFI0_9ACTN|nr:hypothetical protein [Conexibacter arvalis]MBB4663767.1 hypothetical protein [Conexibacter arvalis]
MIEHDLAQLSAELFAPHVGEPFAVRAEGQIELTLVLTEACTLRDAASGERRAPFSLAFRGPEAPLLAQQIVPLEHPVLGRLDLFLVPLGVDADGARYEAVFT